MYTEQVCTCNLLPSDWYRICCWLAYLFLFILFREYSVTAYLCTCMCLHICFLHLISWTVFYLQCGCTGNENDFYGHIWFIFSTRALLCHEMLSVTLVDCGPFWNYEGHSISSRTVLLIKHKVNVENQNY